jgi:hypothetical protein
MLVLPPNANESTIRYLLLETARAKGWFDFVSTNDRGFVDSRGVRYDEETYSIELHDGTPVTLPAAWVEGFVYREALEQDDVESIAYRTGM